MAAGNSVASTHSHKNAEKSFASSRSQNVTDDATISSSCDEQVIDPSHQDGPLVLILDVDNTLYSERDISIACPHNMGVEAQIVRNIHDFGREHYNLSPADCDRLHHEYGSTVEGLRRTIPDDDEVPDMLRRFYHEVYRSVDMSCLLPLKIGEESQSTGYSHATASLRKRQHLLEFIRSLRCPVFLASNSPRSHVLKVLTAMGLRDGDYEGIVTPDSCCDGDNDDDDDKGLMYPTKSSPETFYRPVLKKYPINQYRVVLLDDSKCNIRMAQSIGIDGIHVDAVSGCTLEEALATCLGHILPAESAKNGKQVDEGRYSFADVRYLRSKNEVDASSINKKVWGSLAQELLVRTLPTIKDGTLRIADVGAGLLSILEMMMLGRGDKKSLFAMLSRSELLSSVHYYAYETNPNLISGCRETLLRLGFVPTNREVDDYEAGGWVFRRQRTDTSARTNTDLNMDITVHLRTKDFSTDVMCGDDSLHLVVGCCFADLFDPQELVASMLHFTNTCRRSGGLLDGNDIHSGDVLFYFPITFAGTTQFYPPRPFEISSSIPSDTTAFCLYAESLERKHGHNLDPETLVSAFTRHGGKLLARAPSNWSVSPSQNKYLWETLMYFFGTTAAPEILKCGWDAAGWIRRARDKRPDILVSNTDLLFRLASSDRNMETAQHRGKESNERDRHVDEIQFISPYRVMKITRPWGAANGSHIGPNQIELQSVCSLISSGTELKIFKGMFDDAALDVNIKGMADASMAYPLAYGYSLVGRVTRCGCDVEDAEDILGRLVFTFSPHASRVVVDRDCIQVVPDGIDPDDAIFMPSIETALSLVHDAHVRVGEKVAVYGQGLIGLLVTAVLHIQGQLKNESTGRFGTVTVFDAVSDRLGAASNMGASEALLPSEASSSGPFDVSIEVSGNYHAFQSAIDNTSSGGRIIVGSWYGNTDVRLKLGIDFHRSHKTIKTSQVSEIPAELGGLWTKQRRFSLVWELLRMIRPSRLITKTLSLDEAQTAYELLDGGKEVAIAFTY